MKQLTDAKIVELVNLAGWDAVDLEDGFGERIKKFAELLFNAYRLARISLIDEGALRKLWNEYPIETSEKRGPMLMTVGDTLERAGFMKRPQPLTDEEILEVYDDMVNHIVGPNYRQRRTVLFARAIERAHGIGGEE